MTVKRTFAEKLSDINERAKCPVKLTTDDGRELGIVSWEPRIAVGESVSVVIHAHVFEVKNET
jgi:hypothetical protein